MTTSTTDVRRPGDGLARVHDAALTLFADHGVSGTSLQMIADEIGVTKAAVYYHYKTKEEIVLGVVTPIVSQIEELIERAEGCRGRRAQVETVIVGLVDVVVSSRRVYRVMANDPSYEVLQERHPVLRALATRLVGLLCGPDPAPETRITVLLYLAGLVGPVADPETTGDDEELRRVLVDLGRRLLLQRRHPRVG